MMTFKNFKFSILLALLGMTALSSCSKKELVETVVSDITTNTTQQVLDDHFVFNDQAHEDMLKPTYEDVFDEIKVKKALGEIEVMRYNKARRTFDSVPEILGKQNLRHTYIIRFTDGEFSYMLLEGEKVKSMLPMKKGKVIAGWM